MLQGIEEAKKKFEEGKDAYLVRINSLEEQNKVLLQLMKEIEQSVKSGIFPNNSRDEFDPSISRDLENGPPLF